MEFGKMIIGQGSVVAKTFRDLFFLIDAYT